MLKRYWLVLYPVHRYGPRNIGITAFSPEQAKSLAKNAMENLGWQDISEEKINQAEIIENIDIRKLDTGHVIPNVGVVSRLGVWFPNCNS